MERESTKFHNEREILALEKNFFGILLQFTEDKDEVRKRFKKLIDLYSQQERHYHTLKHIQAMLSFLGAHKEHIKNWGSVVMATWYHDATYDTRSKTNEEKSADLAAQDLQELRLPEDVIDSTKKLILATKRHELDETNPDSAIFLDADLSILARPASVYDAYSENIRKEYGWVPEAEYRIGRKIVLESFLQRERIYFSPFMQNSDVIARENITRELAKLSA